MSGAPSSAALLDRLGRAYEPLRERFGSRHADLLASIDRADRVRLAAEPCGECRWTVSVCSGDQAGVLAVIAGLFATHRIDIRNGDVFSLGGDGALDRVLDVFEVRTAPGVDADFWRDLETELTVLVSLLAEGRAAEAVERLVLGVSEAARGTRADDEPLMPVSVAVDNDASERFTELRIRSPDTAAFLFEFANALTLLEVNIERVEIRTLYGDACDTFWVSDSRGRKIEDPQRIQELRVATVLIVQFAHLLPRSANPSQALRQFTRFASDVLRRPDWTAELEPLGSGDVLRTVAELMGVSRFLWEDFLRLQHENLFPVISDVPGLELAKSRTDLEGELTAALEQEAPEEAAVGLNRFKDREMFRIDLRHITRRIDIDQFSRELTGLAEAIIAGAAQLCRASLRERFGPMDWPWCICGAGKLGGREMGFASDVELVFVCDRGGDGDAEIGPVFEAFAQRFLKTLVARQHGVFEIDLQLRPYGDSAPLSCSLETLRSYYSKQGKAQQFERMALVKLRPIAGDAELGRRIEAVRDAFVYSGEPLDRANIAHLRRRQTEELVAPGSANAKFSPGGLVDVEYFVQARQIEVGHADASVRTTHTLEALARLADAGALERRFAERLARTYGFLRRLIEALRVVRGNAKDLAIPVGEAREFGYLARRLDCASPEALARDLQRHRRFARGLWS